MRQEKLMDVRIHYLRFVHIFCYYCGEEFLDFEEMARKCGGKHLRPPTPSETDGKIVYNEMWVFTEI